MNRFFKPLYILLTAVTVLAVIAPAIPAQALTFKQIQAINNSKPWYDPDDATTATTCGSDDNTPLIGADNAEKIYNFFITQGLQPFQAAGIMGNMAIESGLQPERLQGTASGVITPAESFSGSGGWGLVQWTPGSKFIDTNTPISNANDLGVQLQFLWNELLGNGPLPEKAAGDDIKATTTLADAVLAFQGNRNVGGPYGGFERPADEQGSVRLRTSNAQKYLTQFGSGGTTPTSPTAPVSDCGGSTTVSGNFALPVDQSFYTANPDWFTKPHHDYPSADIPVPTGTKVFAAAGGKIIKAPITTDNTSYGNGVKIDIGNGVIMIYGHGSDGGTIAGAKEGDTVQPGQLIMHSDSTGNVTGPHLHFEIDVNGVQVCPQTWLVAVATGKTPPAFTDLPTTGCTY